MVVTEDSGFFALNLRQCYTMMDKPSEMDCSAHTACSSPTTPRPIHATPPALLATLLPQKKEQNGCGSASCPFFFHPKPWLLMMMCVVQNNKPGHTCMAPGSATLMVTARKLTFSWPKPGQGDIEKIGPSIADHASTAAPQC